jgi:predicted dehydrogenase
MSSHIRAGVVGVGSIGKNHARIYSGLPGVDFSAVLDTDPEAAHAISQQYGVKAVTELSEFAQLIDVATVATPTPDHYAVGT